MQQRCAGLDVHKDEVVACARVAGAGPVQQEVRRFGTTTTALLALAAWLESWGVTHVVMEATGVYWKPVWHVQDETFELVLANAAHVRNVPGRKSDVNIPAQRTGLCFWAPKGGLGWLPPEGVASCRPRTLVVILDSQEF